MKISKRPGEISRIIILTLCLSGMGISLSLAYTQDIELKASEVWPAVKAVFEPYGVAKIDNKKMTLRTNWIEDKVERSRQLLPLKGIEAVEKEVLRQYKFTVSLKEIAGVTRIQIQGRFQEKAQSVRPMGIWKKVKPQSEDYQLERDYFFKILDFLRDQKMATL